MGTNSKSIPLKDRHILVVIPVIKKQGKSVLGILKKTRRGHITFPSKVMNWDPTMPDEIQSRFCNETGVKLKEVCAVIKKQKDGAVQTVFHVFTILFDPVSNQYLKDNGLCKLDWPYKKKMSDLFKEILDRKEFRP